MRKVCDVVMITAEEAKAMMGDVNRYKNELQTIQSYIIEAAQEGKGSVTVYPYVPYCSKTTDILREMGYRIASYKDYKHNRFSYCIRWSDEE